MKKKLILLNSALMIAVAAVSFVAASKNDSKSSLLVQNVEALANGETAGKVTVQCGGQIPLRCYVKCSNCGIEWEAVGDNGGPASNPKGKCSCGKSF